MAKRRSRKRQKSPEESPAHERRHQEPTDYGEEYRTPPPPMRLDELVTAVKPRAPRKPLKDAEIQFAMMLASDGRPRIKQSIKSMPEEGAGRGYALNLRVQGAAIGRHVLPPKPEVREFRPEHGIHERQKAYP